MTNIDVIAMAREAGFETMLRKGCILGFDRDGDYTEELTHFAELVRADEREACATVCDELAGILMCHRDKSGAEIAINLRDTIRARGSNT